MSKLKWDERAVRFEASKYSSKKSFERGCTPAYNSALRLGLIDELFVNQNVCWTDEMVCAEAELYHSRKAFYLGSNKAYQAASRRGLLDSLFGYVKSQWGELEVLSEGLHYNSKRDFKAACPSAYNAALRLGLIDDMGFDPRGSGDNDTIYIWRAVGQYFNGEPIYKIGVTSARLGVNRINQVAAKSGFEYVLICCEEVVCKATDIEKRLLLLGHDPEFIGFDGASEFRAMGDAALWVALGLISEVTVRKT